MHSKRVPDVCSGLFLHECGSGAVRNLLEFIKETQTVWERMATAGKPIVLYGMGDGADKIMNVCGEKKIPIAGIFASDEYVRGHSFRGYPVLTYLQARERFGDFLAVMAFAVDYDAMFQRVKEISQDVELVIPHVPLFNDLLFEPAFLRKHETELLWAYEQLADELSRRVFADMLNFKISGKLEYLWQSTTDRLDDCRKLLQLGPHETYVDLGAYRGDTVQEFLLLTDGKYEKILAVEPDKKSFQKLQLFAEKMGLKNIRLENKGIWECCDTLSFNNRAGRNSCLSVNGRVNIAVDSLDHLLQGEKVTLIKMDVEGAEKQALRGAKQTISQYRPKLFVSAYHYDKDLFELPKIIKEICPQYRFYLRRHPYIPAWEINYFAIPE